MGSLQPPVVSVTAVLVGVCLHQRRLALMPDADPLSSRRRRYASSRIECQPTISPGGQVRDFNEDVYLALLPPGIASKLDGLLVVGDGQTLARSRGLCVVFRLS